jgi:hypothetical protein
VRLVVLVEADGRGHVHDPLKEFSLLQPRHGVIPPLEFGRRHPVAGFERRRLNLRPRPYRCGSVDHV